MQYKGWEEKEADMAKSLKFSKEKGYNITIFIFSRA